MAGNETHQRRSLIDRLILWSIDNKLVVFLMIILAGGYGILVAPFDWNLGGLPRDPVPVDAIPDLGENQQIVFTEWPGRSPQDVEDQVTYPLTVAMLGVPEVKTIRSYSYFGFSSIYVIFEEGADFYDSRSRILEKLGSLAANTLPPGVTPALGPDATALGQVFWYTLQGLDQEGKPTGGWDLEQLRTIQDWYVKDALLAADGIAEVASIGGFVREYQVDVDPDALQQYGIGLDAVFNAVRNSNVDIGARTIEINGVEYVVRGVGFLKSLDDIAISVVTVRDNVPITIGDLAQVKTGPALRRGVLDVGGAEAVGGVVVVRYGDNPLAAIKNVKEKIAEIAGSLPRKELPDGRISQVTIVPFYDRTGLINETLGTLSSALSLEILITVIVVIMMVRNPRSGLLIAGLLPMAVLLCFVAMKIFAIDANIVALSGIAIAIGTMVDMGVILNENILRGLDEAGPGKSRREVIFTATSEVGGALVTAVSTTVISFLPVFTLIAAEGKLFRPLAFTKTFALLAAVVVAIVVIPPLAHLVLRRRTPASTPVGDRARQRNRYLASYVLALVAAVVLTWHWLPLGAGHGLVPNFLFVVLCLGGILTLFLWFRRGYPRLLRWCLGHKLMFLSLPTLLIVLGLTIWLGFDRVFAFLPGAGAGGADGSAWSRLWTIPRHTLPGLGKEFMPPLDEGSFLFMPTTMPHASIGEAQDVLEKLDMAIASIPEVAQVVGKLGRAESPLDPAPISMIETVINYLPEYKLDQQGHRQRFRFDRQANAFAHDDHGELIPDSRGKPYRQWRDEGVWFTKVRG